ncbi:MAG: DUF5777 family beta-barrel protein [Terriglobales bacterium]
MAETKKMMIRNLVRILAIFALGLMAVAAQAPNSTPTPADGFASVEPIFRAHCLGCHNQTVKAGGLVLASYASLREGGKHGAVVVPFHSVSSRMMLLLEGKLSPRMPLSEPPLNVAELATIRSWIQSGAPGPQSAPAAADGSEALAAQLGIEFVPNSNSTLIVQRNGKRFRVDLLTHSITEVEMAQAAAPAAPAATPPAGGAAPKTVSRVSRQIYQPGDDVLFTLPSGRRLTRHGLYVNFSHRFAFEPAFSGDARGHLLGGLDSFAISSFGFRYGITDRLSVEAYRSPSIIGRPIELSTGYTVWDENDGRALNIMLRAGIAGQNDFGKNFTESLEAVVSRSLSHRAQLYAVPTWLINDRQLESDHGALTDGPPTLPAINSFSLGLAGAVDVRPSVALIAEIIPTLVHADALGIHRPVYSFAIQEKIFRHAFTLGFTTGPGTITAQRAGTRATFLRDPGADTPGGLFIGFDLTRQIR